MRVLYVYCHPVPESFHGAIRDLALERLRSRHDVDLLDLYAEGFDPVLGAEERRRYHDTERNREGIEPYLIRLRKAEGLVLQFPTWCFGPPAMLKGWLDRVIIPGFAFDLTDPADAKSLLWHIGKIAGVVTYGRSRGHAWWMGDPPRKLVTRYLRWFASATAKVDFHALYGMNTATAAQRDAFLAEVGRAMGEF
jgi:putative NADPH-quinone reductase